MILHLPDISPARFNNSIKLTFRIGLSLKMSIDIGLLNIFERSIRVAIHRGLPFVISKVVSLGSRHPVRHILAIFAE